MSGAGTGTVAASSDLASASDLATYGYPAGASAYLARASARVRGYTRQTITSGTSTVTLDYPFRLPQRPLVTITSITDEDGTEITSEDYTLRGSYIVIDAPVSPITVTYTHGFTALPDELVELVCAVAARMAAAPAGLAAGYQSESADGESIAYGSDAFAGVAELTSAEKRVLDRIFALKAPSVVVML